MSESFVLVYTSQFTESMHEEQVGKILEVSRRNNQADELTGLLIVRDGFFLQLLEGPKDKVLNCMQRIRQDVRHRNIVVHGELTIDQRLMPDWSMGLVDERDVKSSSASLIDLFELGRLGQQYHNSKSLLAIVRMFAKEARII